MKTLSYFAMLFFLLLGSASCNTKSVETDGDMFNAWKNSGKNVANKIDIVANGLVQNPDNPIVTVSGILPELEPDRSVPSVELTVQNLTIMRDKRPEVLYSVFRPSAQNFTQAKGIFGNKVDLSFFSPKSKNARMSSTDAIYVPQIIRLDVGGSSSAQTLDLSRDLVVKWNSDSQNSKPVVVVITAQLSPQSEVITVSKTSPDDGELVITAADLAKLPTNASSSITVARGAGDVISVGGKDVQVSALTYSASINMTSKR